MIKINGLKVIGPSKVVIGKVVELPEDGSNLEFKLVEYYVNEYNKYLNRTIDTFYVEPHNSSQEYIKEFKEKLGQYGRLKDIYVEKSVMEILTKMQ